MKTLSRFKGGSSQLVRELRTIVGRGHVFDSPRAMRPFLTGYRYGHGQATAVVRPGSLVEFWKVLQICVKAGTAVICQAANTGLTGGSTPYGSDYPAGVMLISTNRISGIQLLDSGKQVICLAGTTLHQLERALRPVSRDPHSVIGSSCIGASVIGGICNNSGGALVRRGPAFTQMALFAQIDEAGELQLVNHLGVDLGRSPEEILGRLERRAYGASDIGVDAGRWGSDRDYEHHIRQIEAHTPARFNADARRLFEASGCAGKLAVFAVRLDTFERAARTATFYLGTNRAADLTQLRRDVLSGFRNLPISAEYMHRDAFDLSVQYGKDTLLAIHLLGTDRIPALNRLKSYYDAVIGRLVPVVRSDRVLQAFSRFLPQHMPARLRSFRDQYEHHLILTVADDAIDEARAYLASAFRTADAGYFECSVAEAQKAQLNRFVVAGAAVRYQAVHPSRIGGIVALDVALPRKERNWLVELPPELEGQILSKIFYGHFLCHVFHLDYLVRGGEDVEQVKTRLLGLLDDRAAEYPAEHNVGHLYEAKPVLRDFYRKLDPRNQLNPGIGRTTKH